MDNVQAVEYRYLNDAVFHQAVDQAAHHAAEQTFQHLGEPMLPGFRKHQVEVARRAILTWVAVTGQTHHAFTWTPITVGIAPEQGADHYDPTRR